MFAHFPHYALRYNLTPKKRVACFAHTLGWTQEKIDEAGLVSELCWNNFERTLVGLLSIAEFVVVWWASRDGSFSPLLYERIDSALKENPHEWKPRSNQTWTTAE